MHTLHVSSSVPLVLATSLVKMSKNEGYGWCLLNAFSFYNCRVHTNLNYSFICKKGFFFYEKGDEEKYFAYLYQQMNLFVRAIPVNLVIFPRRWPFETTQIYALQLPVNYRNSLELISFHLKTQTCTTLRANTSK